ncbi:P2X purinoceptor 7-like [Mizuhopecten yessoensis]|uniref:P2X purinoceptor 7-like n=1 Tax=Mizuhopecten yessoensis TaxID=6573 RepID=UPI000B4581AB|nr:P2X purinoceptor 7-like [Mizuhopecten yessoensis]
MDSESSTCNSDENRDYEESGGSSSPMVRGRGTRASGRPSRRRGPGRGVRGRGRGRGQYRAPAPTSAELARQEQEERRRSLEFPSIIFDINDAPGMGGHHPPPGSVAPDWCSCGNCRDMPTEVERRCCRHTPELCTTLMPDFRVIVLHEAVLAVARLYRQDVLAIPNDDDYNRGNRHAAYRQFVLWQHGRLGAGVRAVIPSCCVWAIRDKYPDQYGQYVGFVPSRLE